MTASLTLSRLVTRSNIRGSASESIDIFSSSDSGAVRWLAPITTNDTTTSALRLERAATLVVEGQDLQLDCEIDLAHRYLLRHRDHGRGEVENRRDSGRDHPRGHLLRRGRRRGDQPDGDVLVADQIGELVEVADVDVVDRRAHL